MQFGGPRGRGLGGGGLRGTFRLGVLDLFWHGGNLRRLRAGLALPSACARRLDAPVSPHQIDALLLLATLGEGAMEDRERRKRLTTIHSQQPDRPPLNSPPPLPSTGRVSAVVGVVWKGERGFL